MNSPPAMKKSLSSSPELPQTPRSQRTAVNDGSPTTKFETLKPDADDSQDIFLDSGFTTPISGRRQPAYRFRSRPFVAPPVNPYDYETRYPEDPYGEESGPTARVWKTYLDECEAYDLEKVEGWRESVDVLLIFAGLFSAVVTAFVVQSSSNLEIDYAKASAVYLEHLILLQYAAANGSSITSIPIPSPMQTDTSVSDFWINALWYASLVLSLVTALFAALTKQWLYHYQCVPSGTPRDRCRIRQFRHTGFEVWLVPVILDMLPVILHLSLSLFLAGLIIYLAPLDIVISGVVATMTGIAYLSYLISVILPLMYPQCPYKSPLAIYLYSLYSRFSVEIHRIVLTFLRLFSSKRPVADRPRPPASLFAIEKEMVTKMAENLDRESIFWLFAASSNSSVRNIAIQALSGLPPGLTKRLPDDCEQHLTASIIELSRPRLGQKGAERTIAVGSESQLERLLRASLQDDLHRKYNWPKLYLENIFPASSHLTALLDIEPWLRAHPSVYPVMIHSYILGSNKDVVFHRVVWEHILGRNTWFKDPNTRGNGFSEHMQLLEMLIMDLNVHDWWFGATTAAALEETPAGTLADMIKSNINLRRSTARYLFWSFGVPFVEECNEQTVQTLLIDIVRLLKARQHLSSSNNKSYRNLLCSVLTCLLSQLNSNSPNLLRGDWQHHHETIADVMFSLIISDCFFDNNNGVSNLEIRILALELFVKEVAFNRDPDGVVLASRWQNKPFVRNIMQLVLECHSQLERSDLRSQPITGLTQGYSLLGLLLRNECSFEAFWVEEIFDLLQLLPFTSRMKHSSGWLYHNVKSKMHGFLSNYAKSLQSAPPHWVDKVYNPELLFGACRVLVLFRDEDLLVRLAQECPDHKSWKGCLRRLLDLLNDDDFIQNHMKYQLRGIALPEQEHHHAAGFNFNFEKPLQECSCPQLEISAAIGKLMNVLGSSVKDLDVDMQALAGRFLPVRRAPTHLRERMYDSGRTTESSSHVPLLVGEKDRSPGWRLFNFSRESGIEKDV